MRIQIQLKLIPGAEAGLECPIRRVLAAEMGDYCRISVDEVQLGDDARPICDLQNYPVTSAKCRKVAKEETSRDPQIAGRIRKT